MKKSAVTTKIILLVAIAVVINLIAYHAFFRLDFTADQRYTLSAATKDIVGDLDQTVTITAYFTQNLPPFYDKIRQEFRDKLVEYQNASGGNIVYKFVDPADQEWTDEEMIQKGIYPTQFQVTEQDEVITKKGFMGAEIAMGTQKETIPSVPASMQNGSSIEYELTKVIKKMSVQDKPKIGLLSGHGEAGQQQLQEVISQLSVLYEVQPLTITPGTPIEKGIAAIAMLNPTDTFPSSHLSALDDYLASGGSLLVGLSTVAFDQQQSMVVANDDIGVKAWLAAKGINIENVAVKSAACGKAQIQRPGNFAGMQMMINEQINFFYWPLVQDYAEHPITTGIQLTMFNFASPISYSPKDGVNYTALAKTNELSATEPLPTLYDFQKKASEADFQEGSQVVALAAEGPLVGTGLGRLVVMTDGTMGISEGRGSAYNNAAFVINAIDWLADQTGLLQLRNKGVVYRPLKTEGMNDFTRELIKYGNLSAPILLLLGFGLYRRMKNNSRRTKWIEGKY